MISSLVYKITMLGDGAVGKTSLRNRFMGKLFNDSYTMTIGTDFAAKMVEVDGQEIKFQIWDIAGQPHFTKVRKLYYEGSLGALIIFDITAPQSFPNVLNWIEELWKNNSKKYIPIIILGNKVDLRGAHPPSQTVESSHGELLAQTLSERVSEKGFEVPYLETSAKTGENVDEAFTILGQTILNFVRARFEDTKIQ